MKKKFGDRKDGKRIRTIDSIHKIMPYLMNNRCDAEVYLCEKIDVTNLLKFLEKKNKDLEKAEKTTFFHALTTAAAKTVYERPLLNRFIQGKRYYERNEISLSFVAKTNFEDNAEEMLIKLIAKDNDNLDGIKENILNQVNKIRREKTNNIDQTLNLITSGPRFLTSFITFIIKKLDFHGLVPTSLTEGDPNYSTILLSNLGSIKCNHAYHHLNNYGTNSLMITIGMLHKEEIIINDSKEIRDIIEIGVTGDERIADGFYFAKSISLFKYIINNPEILERPLKEKINFETEN